MSSAIGSMNNVKIGWSEVSLVPNGRKVNLVGQFYERISGEIETPISVTALAMECGDDCMIHVACDLVSTSRKLLNAVRDALPADCGFPKEKLIISAIHTHTSMGYADRGDGLSRLSDNHDERLSERSNCGSMGILEAYCVHSV